MRAEDGRKLEVVHLMMDQPPQQGGKYFARESYRCFSGWAYPTRFQEGARTLQAKNDRPSYELGKRRSAECDIDAKDQFHTNSRKKGRRSRYDDMDTTDMVVAGYVNNDHDDNHDGPR
jgi:hypothetical protein